MTGFATLLYKELLRFWKVSFQTMAAPVLTALLYLLIFAHALEGRVNVYRDVSYTRVPGAGAGHDERAAERVRQQLLQPDPVEDHRQPGVRPARRRCRTSEFFWAYVLASMARAMAVGLGVLAAGAWFVPLRIDAPLWALAFALLGSALLGTLGLVAGIRAERFGQLAGFQNFVILPLTFLSGVFYSIHSLPSFWQGLSHANPFFYMIDGFRYGFFGVSDVSPVVSLTVVGLSFVLIAAGTLWMLKRGYKLRG